MNLVLKILQKVTLFFVLDTLLNMSKRLYSDVVKANSSKDAASERLPLDPPEAGSIVNWLTEYQVEEEHVALQKALDLSKVRFF